MPQDPQQLDQQREADVLDRRETIATGDQGRGDVAINDPPTAVDDPTAPRRQLGQLVADALRELEACSDDPRRQARLHHALGVIFEQRFGDQRRAAHHYQQAYRADPDDIASIRAARQIFSGRQNWTMVLTLLDAELRLTSTAGCAAELLLQKGRIYQGWLANGEAAGAAFREALERDPGNPQVLQALRRLYQQRGNSERLLAVCRQAVAGISDHRQRSLLYAEIGRIHEAEGQVEAAIEAYSTAFAENPNHASVISALKRLYQRQGRFGDLVDVLLSQGDMAEQLGQEMLCYVTAARICRDQLQQPDRALELLGRVRQHLHDADGSVLHEMIELLRQSGRYADLADVYKQLSETLQDVGERVVVHHRLGQLYEERLARETDALLEYRRAAALDPTYVPALQALGRLYQRRGMWGDLAALQATEAEASADAEVRASRLCGVAQLCEMRLGDRGRAIEFYRRALNAVADYVPAERELERLFGESGSWAELLQIYQSQLQRCSDEPAARLLARMAQLCLEKLDDRERALRYYREALELLPDDRTLLQAVGQILRDSGRYEELIEVVDREVELAEEPALALALAHRAAEICEQWLDRPEEAADRYRKILAHQSGHPAAVKSLGRLLHRLGQWSELIALFRSELEQGTVSGERRALLLYKTGEIHEEQLGQREQAIACFEQALETVAGFRPALDALARIYRGVGDWERLVGVLETMAGLATDTLQKAVLLSEIGELWELQLGRGERALHYYRRAFGLAPEHDLSREGLQRLLMASGNAGELVDVYRRALQDDLDPRSRLYLIKLVGEILAHQLMDLPRAIGCFEEALALDGEDTEALEALGRLYRETGRQAPLVDALRRLAASCEDTTHAVHYLFEAASVVEVHLQPDYDVAPIYEQIVAQEHSAPALDALMRIYSDRQAHRKLVRVAERQLSGERSPQARRTILLRLAGAREAIGDLEGAVEAAAEAAEEHGDWLVVSELRRLLEACEEWQKVTEALGREAAVSHDRSLAVKSLVKAATVHEERLGDVERAIDALEKVLQLEPFHDEAATRLEGLLVREERWQRLVEVAERRLSASGEHQVLPRIELLSRIAWIQREHLEQPADAVTTLLRALKLDPNHLPTLLTLGELHLSLEQWQDAVKIFTRVVALSDDPELLRRVQYEMGEIWSERLGDQRQAISCFQNVLAVAPEDRRAVKRLYQLFVACRDWENAADTVGRLGEMEVEPRRRIDHFLALAEIQEKGFGDPEMAVEQLEHALSVEPGDERLSARLAELLGRLGRWEAVAETLENYLEALPPDELARGQAQRHQLGEVLSQRLGRPAEALAVYEQAIACDGDDLPAYLACARLQVQQGELERAVAAHRAVLEREPLNVESLRQLRSLWSRMRQHDLAFAATAVMVTFGLANEVEQRIHRDYRAKRQHLSGREFDAVLYEKHVMHPVDRGFATARGLLAALAEAAHRIRPPELSEWQVGKSDRLPARSEDPLRSIVRDIRQSLGLSREIDVYLSGARPRGFGLLMTDPPALVAGTSVMSHLESKEVRWSIARLLSYVRNRCWIAHDLDGRQLGVLVHGICRVVDPAHFAAGLPAGEAGVLDAEARQAIDEREVEEMARTVQRSIGRRGRRALEELVPQLLAELPDFTTWAQAMELTAARTALWLVDDLEVGVAQVRRRLPQLAKADADEMARHPLLAELIGFWMSDGYARAHRGTA